MSLADEIRNEIESVKEIRITVGDINNHLSVLEGLTRKDIEEREKEAYQRGFEDGKKSVSEPDRIEVGDEVVWSYGATIVVTMTYVDGGVEWCDGVSKDGRACHVYLENVRKTGKHYDIASILEAMRE